ncbi:dUTP diphosphatase [Ectothiorhodospira shaposhnikovii]|nr:dUTP diphosphatase [Ectothiorhodospira shaposhnikovii]MCG5512794.1 dUTP diphosphatase [Ectothiorhodospira shaposhnikovii]
MNLPVQIKILDDRIGATFDLPAYKSDMAAGLDLLAAIDKPLRLAPNQVELVGTGIAIWINNPGYAAMIVPRSGLGHKHGIVCGNLTGIIDADYQGQLHISVWNRSEEHYVINPGDRIAQLLFVPIARADFEVVSDFHANTVRGCGGFGSTGISGVA